MLKKQMQLGFRGDAEQRTAWDGLPCDVRAEVVERWARLIAKAAKPETNRERIEKHADDGE